MKIIKEKIFKVFRRKDLFSYLNIKIIILIFVAFYLLVLQKKIFKQKTDKIRALNDDNDPRSKGPNENCMAFVNEDLYTVFRIKGKVYFRDDYGITLSLCENIENTKSSCILKNGTNTIRLAGDINGEINNKNKLVIINDTLIKIYLAAGDICKDQERYKVDITIKTIEIYEEKESEDEDLYDEKHTNYISKSGCHYSVKINQNVATIYKIYYGFNLTIALRIILGIGLFILGLVIKIFTSLVPDLAYYITLFIGLYFILSAIIDLASFDIYLVIFGGIFGPTMIYTCIIIGFKGENINEDSQELNALLGVLCGYPMIKMISIFTIIFIKTTYQRLIHNIFLIIFSICGGIIGGKYPKTHYHIGSNIVGNYLMVKGLSYIFYYLAPPIDEQKIYDLAKTENFEKKNEMINGLGLIYPILFCVMSLINTPLKNLICKIFKRSNQYSEPEKKNNEYELSISIEKEEKYIEAPYYETQN